ncbi:MAG TPA: DUF2760 domain-containing protein [Planctomicrobium sp.]|nr:DUF2760 domain-containing protein [Planctomicrobium sp.]
MGRVGLAFRIFFDVLFHAETAEQVRHMKGASTDAAEQVPASLPAPTAPTPKVEPAKPKPAPSRSDALTLLETLQREARFLDFVQEDMSAYSNEQVGGAVRDVHRGCQTVLKRLFNLGPAISTPEGSSLTLNGEEPAAQIRLVGNVVDRRPVNGVVVHPGWKAERCDLPTWSGNLDFKTILAPAEVELS